MTQIDLQASAVALQVLEAIRATNPDLIADNMPRGWGMNRLRHALARDVRSEQTNPAAWSEFIERACANIKAADDACAGGDYMLDSNDCISVLKGEWTGPILHDMPQPDRSSRSKP